MVTREMKELLARVLFVGGVLCLGTSLLWPRVGSAPARRRSQCVDNLKLLALGLQEYVDVYKCFPPAYIADEQGRPVHSWRVLVLPYIEQKALYDQYDFNEPWDGPNNRELARQMPDVFHCPSDEPLGGAQNDKPTSYVAVVGSETLWLGSETMPLGEIRDGLSNTILLVEVTNSGIPWTEPRDLPSSAIQAGINPPQGLGPSSNHPGDMYVAFADGSVRSIQRTMSLEVFHALFTRSGGETIPDDY
jgi:prepilin-type processing-associated H-X9-DG protein